MVNPSTPSPQARREVSDNPLEQPAVTRQLSQLFGESLLGPWPELLAVAPGGSVRRSRTRRWLWRLGAVVIVATTTAGTYHVLVPGLTRQDNTERDRYAGELRSFLAEGDLERAELYASLLRARGFGSNAAHLELMVLAEAALYRYFDADPARYERIRAHLGLARESALLRVATLTVMSREERAQHLPEFERLSRELPSHHELEYLRASALSFLGEREAARQAWRRAAQVGPAWYIHRFEQAQYEVRLGEIDAAERTVRQMLRMAPLDAWVRLAVGRFGGSLTAAATVAPGDARAPASPLVERFTQKLLESIDLASRGESAAAARLFEGLALVHGQPPFVLDAFDEIVWAKQFRLARELVAGDFWPRDAAVARLKVERLAAEERKP